MKHTKSSPPIPRATLLRPCDAEALQWDMQEIQLAIARRAYELFESRNREHGHDWEDWFQAESELLRPVSVAISDTTERFSVRANILGFSDNELKVSIEAKRISILGRKELAAVTASHGAPPAEYYPDQVLRVIDLPSEIDPAGALVELQSGVLRFELPKAVKAEAMAVGAA